MLNMSNIIVAIDFDGTVVKHEFPKIGESIGAEEVLYEMVDAGAQLVLFTMRDKCYLDEAVEWFNQRNIPLVGINVSPNQLWTTSPKAYADIYIDDSALGTPIKMDDQDKRGYVDWVAIRKLLYARFGR